MGVIAFALSVQHFISTVGADAGFAAIIGLALLVLLYFAQARETASLRDRVHETVEHVQELEARVAQLSQLARSLPGSPAVAPAPAPAGITSPGRGRVATAGVGAGPIIASRNPGAANAHAIPDPALVPSAPAGVAAPALTAATRLIPVGASADFRVETVPAAASAPGAVREPAGVAAELSGGGVAVAGPPPATAAGGANGAAQTRTPRPAAAGSPPPPRAQIRPGGSGGGGRPGGPLRRPPVREERSGPRRAVLVVVGLLGVVVVVAGLLVLTSGGTTTTTAGSSTPARTTNAPRTRHKARPGPLRPSSITVAVLNGTATNGLAGRVATRLTAAGYKKGTVATAPDQTHTATIIAYLPNDRKDALAVASTLKLGSASVQPVDPTNQAVACPPSAGACAANVVAIVGADLASTP